MAELEEEQEIWSWGAGTEGQLGTESEKDELVPRLVSCLSSVSVSALSWLCPCYRRRFSFQLGKRKKLWSARAG
ncbi:hypothetical protein MLD38_026797 [Melastoma candidum]|uniref:Uncharacterized protein n=1 Tax=Melastoma candidum TaxID=119954 RepID=A0ACB9P197_9MYRT|nr:hypothetical protein MLD38_026797 [Melastoma candidum]